MLKNVCVCVCVYIYIYMYVCMHVCMYVCMYIHIYIYICMFQKSLAFGEAKDPGKSGRCEVLVPAALATKLGF